MLATTQPAGHAVSELAHTSKFMETELAQPACTGIFALAHLVGEGQPTLLLERRVDMKLPPKERRARVLEIAQEFNDSATHAITTQTLPQVYAIVTLAKDGKTPVSHWPFRLYPPVGNTIGMLTEGATPQGQQLQAMRLTEVGMRLGVETSKDNNELLYDFAKELIAERREMIKEHRERENATQKLVDESTTKRLAAVALIEDLTTKKLQRDLIMKRFENHEKHIEGLWQNVDGVLRLLLERNGVKLPVQPGSNGSPIEKLHELVKSLKPEQQIALANILDERQQGLLADALKGFGVKEASA
jgi:hypothetical protein